jgi:hypothetical protein
MHHSLAQLNVAVENSLRNPENTENTDAESQQKACHAQRARVSEAKRSAARQYANGLRQFVGPNATTCRFRNCKKFDSHLPGSPMRNDDGQRLAPRAPARPSAARGAGFYPQP